MILPDVVCPNASPIFKNKQAKKSVVLPPYMHLLNINYTKVSLFLPLSGRCDRFHQTLSILLMFFWVLLGHFGGLVTD
jgi:hypothetical protein